MKNLKEIIIEKLQINKDSKSKKINYTFKEFIDLLSKEIDYKYDKSNFSLLENIYDIYDFDNIQLINITDNDSELFYCKNIINNVTSKTFKDNYNICKTNKGNLFAYLNIRIKKTDLSSQLRYGYFIGKDTKNYNKIQIYKIQL